LVCVFKLRLLTNLMLECDRYKKRGRVRVIFISGCVDYRVGVLCYLCFGGFYLSRKIVVEIELPDWVRLPRGEVEKRVKVELALRLYQKGIVSMGQARRLAGLSKWDFLELLAKEKIPLSYDVEEVEKDLKTVEELFK